MNLDELNKKLEDNTLKILTNLERIESNSNKIDDNAEKIQRNSYALDILKDYKNENKRLFIIVVVILIMWFLTIGYLVYILNDIGTIDETTVTQENENGYNNYIGNDGDIINGKANN